MTIVKNIKAQLRNSTEQVPYAVFLLTLLDQPVKEGITVNEMRKSLNLIEKLDKAVKEDLSEIEFDEDEIAKVKSAVENAQWKIIDKAIIDFSDYITSLK